MLILLKKLSLLLKKFYFLLNYTPSHQSVTKSTGQLYSNEKTNKDLLQSKAEGKQFVVVKIYSLSSPPNITSLNKEFLFNFIESV